MDNFSEKTKAIYIPFVKLVFFTLSSLILVNWLFGEQLSTLANRHFYLSSFPFLLSAALCIVMVKPLGILTYKGNFSRSLVLIIMVFYLSMLITMVQDLPRCCSNEVKSYNDPYSLNSSSHQGNITLKNYNVMRNKIIDKISLNSRSARGGSIISISNHVSVPLNISMTVWAVFPFSQDIKANSSETMLNSSIHALRHMSRQHVNSYDFSDVKYFKLIPDSDYRDNYISSIYEKYPKLKGKKLTILSPENIELKKSIYIKLGFLFFILIFGGMCLFVVIELQSLKQSANDK
ncbi:hypothetical protein RAL01_004337 [Vibrio vulnificus]|uniref:hypothetical protein n=1 Tax=Vibrio vulnificus TaxID=672 RepID=UPI0002D8D70F|nr:hypothetical protein [Vibrio vulnificus]ASM97571.1 hypothetical protein AOT11_20920 [Vibrio vulnificus NBRC 15645 = ATCC 27562]EGQ7964377.1 hypothetical protein [Vibrio vulnificus]EGQ9976243.1 hypothetical protein [Vibrio vulnificus]EHZ7124191.1 hypothetical protein [Vibrio vulnificus]EIJ0948545.1 hypothetical protein [Vibrio vulnificus]